MFQDLDSTLKSILDDSKAPAELFDADVSFVVPDRDYKPGTPTVNLFLHGVKENRDLRNNAPTVEIKDGVVTSLHAPLRVDCTYLVTAWAKSDVKDEQSATVQHQILGQALLWLSRFPVIPVEYLQGDLKTQPYGVPALVAQMPGDAGLGQFWTALGIAPRPSFYLTVTIAMQVITEPEKYPEFTKPLTDLVSITEPGLHGTVADKTNHPVPSATVTVKGTRKSATTDGSGQFRLEGLAPGTYRLLVKATGFANLEQEVTFTSRHQAFNLIVE